MNARAAAILVAASALLVPHAATGTNGKTIYAQACAQCHTNGVAGAPRTGDRAAWMQRLAVGREALLTTVLRGKGAMPPKGGNASLSDADAQAATDYMLGGVK